jgi:hypothetical protein
MYLYLSIWAVASAVVLTLVMYRRALLHSGMSFAYSDPDVDGAEYERVFNRRLQLIDRWVRAVAVGCPGTVFGHAMLRFSWQIVHGTATWHVIRSVVER